MSSQLFNIYLFLLGAWLLLDIVTCFLVIILELQFVQFLEDVEHVASYNNIQHSQERKEEYHD